MKLENQVCSLELSKKLKELGVGQESYFYWLTYIKDKNRSEIEHLLHYKEPKYLANCQPFSAFTVAELGEMLPAFTGSFKLSKIIQKKGEKFKCHKSGVDDQNAETEADARAKMLIYLLENKLITL